MADKAFADMSDDELRAERDRWEANVANASGPSSAVMASKCLGQVCVVANRRGLNFVNKHPITKG